MEDAGPAEGLRLSHDIPHLGDGVAVDTTTSVVMCERIDDVLALAEERGKAADILTFETGLHDDVQLQLLESAVAEGAWYVLTHEAPESLLRSVARSVFPRPAYAIHDAFRLFYVLPAKLRSEAELARVPAIFRNATLDVQAPLHAELMARQLAHAVGRGSEHLTRRHGAWAAVLTWADQIALFRLCTSSEAMCLLAGHVDIAAQGAKGVRLLDVALEKRFEAAVKLVCDAGGKSELVDLPSLSHPGTEHLLHAVVNSARVPFDEVTATHAAACVGDVEVLKALFSACLDRSFAYSDYPLAHVMLRDDTSVAQMLVDRMERVGLPPFRSAEVSLHFLLETLSGGDDPARPVPPPPSCHATLKRFCRCVADEGAPPYHVPRAAVEMAMQHCPAILDDLLTIADPSIDSAMMARLYIERLPGHPAATRCVQHYLAATPQEGPERLNVVKRTIFRGAEALPLTRAALAYIKDKDALLDCYVCGAREVCGTAENGMAGGVDDAEWRRLERGGGVLVGRTLLMVACTQPGYPGAVAALLDAGCDPNIRNELGRNPLQHAVASAAGDPLAYKERLPVYGELCRRLVEGGADASVTALSDTLDRSLVAAAARHELAPLCHALMLGGAGGAGGAGAAGAGEGSAAAAAAAAAAAQRAVFFGEFPENLRACVVSHHCAVQPAEGSALPFLAKKPRCPSSDDTVGVEPLTTGALLRVLSFLDGPSLVCFSQTNAYHYGLACRDDLWVTQTPVEKRGGAAQFLCPSAVFSAKKLCRDLLVSGEVCHKWVETPGQPGCYTCLYTGETLAAAGIPSSGE